MKKSETFEYQEKLKKLSDRYDRMEIKKRKAKDTYEKACEKAAEKYEKAEKKYDEAQNKFFLFQKEGGKEVE